MMRPSKLSAAGLLLIMLMMMSAMPSADVMMTGSITGFGMDIKPAASFTTDDWLNTPNMFTITVMNGPEKTVRLAEIFMEVTHSGYGSVLSGTITITDADRPQRGFLPDLPPGRAYTINNTMLKEDTPQMSGGDWSQGFKDEVIRVGGLPEGRYTMSFSLTGHYASAEDPIESGNEIFHFFEIKNPTPPELMTPNDMSDDVVSVPRFVWQRPQVSNLSNINNRVIMVFYNLKVWRMFGNDGSVISEEDAIQRVPIWEVNGLTSESIGFDPGTAWEELIPGRKYCWQVQAIDGGGRPISPKNDGKSDVWQFTCKFRPPVLNEPFRFYPFNFSWTAAQAGGGVVNYRVRIADNPDFAGGLERRNIVMTQFSYPNDAPPLRLGVMYNLELQATDDSGIPIGEPVAATFTIPVSPVVLRAPADGSKPSTKSPRFEWDGNARFYVVMIYDEESDWTSVSGAVEGKSWEYDGEELQSGKTYAWNVAPANEMGDTVGASSDTWYFSLPGANQVVLTSPLNVQVDTIFPMFTWQALESPTGQGAVEYSITIEDRNGNAVQTARTTVPNYQYPQDAPMLRYGARYEWFITAFQENVAIGVPSERGSFTTPLSGEADMVSTMEELGDIVKVVLGEYPEFDPFKEKVLVSVSDENGPMTPSAFLELFDTYKIVRVTGK